MASLGGNHQNGANVNMVGATGGTANNLNGNMSSQWGQGAHSNVSSSGLPQATVFANPCFQDSSTGTKQDGGFVSTDQDMDFPPICRTMETVKPDLVEAKTSEQIQRQNMDWKTVASKSLLERHPQWAVAHDPTLDPNPYAKGLKQSEGLTVTAAELQEVIHDVNNSINVEEYKLGDTIQVDVNFFSCRLRHLQNCAFVLCALDSAPTKDRVVDWARVEMWQKRSTPNISRKLKDHVKIKLEGIDEPMIQPVWYTSLPNVCFACHQRGHIAKDCPAYKEEEQQDQKVGSQPPDSQNNDGSDKPVESEEIHVEQEDNDGFTKVSSKRKGHTHTHDVSQENSNGAGLQQQLNNEDVVEVGMDEEEDATDDEQGKMQSKESGEALKDINTNGEAAPASRQDKQPGNQSPSTASVGAGFPGEALAVAKSLKQSGGANGSLASGERNEEHQQKSKKSPTLGQVRKVSLKKAARKHGGKKNPDRLRVARRWLDREHKGAKIIAFQELKALETQLNFNLSKFWEKGRVVRQSRVPVGVISIYAPNNERERRELWTWLRFFLDEGDWILTGDYNSVELPDDTEGPTALLNGGELRTWKSLTSEKELVDAYLCASFTKGPRFTRQVFSGDRADQARLDRCYFTNGGAWFHHVHKIHHDAGQALSDHCPVIINLVMVEAEQENIRRCSYFKMNSDVLKKEETRNKVKEAWQNHPPGITDPRVKWTLGWGRIRKTLKALGREEKVSMCPLVVMRTELIALKMRMQNDSAGAIKERVTTLEGDIRRRELADAKTWRLRSRIRWLAEGEAPSHYFFAQLKAKYARETIQFLRDQEGRETRQEGEIKNQVTKYFQKQFKCVEPEEEDLQLRREVLELLDKKATAEQNQSLVRWPTAKEVDELGEDLPRDKAPGLDGITNNMMQDCWDFLRHDCLEMFEAFWAHGVIPFKDSQGVIKLLPKSDEKWLLKNWRPIMLMGVTLSCCMSISRESAGLLYRRCSSYRKNGKY
ncbi:hypothetical protein R1sor_017315 [Riccia sorocarpa]|uniref:CCHC-type domain-containing protein n=1 Tax=Riccia sorocarpa TaxID=122646 RepID=A0ABD3I6V7_9MARC